MLTSARQMRFFAVRAGVLLSSVFFLSAASLHAQQKVQSCPWLNKATAEGVLGTDVNMNVSRPSMRGIELINGAQPDAVCDFVPVHAAPGAMLRIAVHTMQDRAKEYSTFTSECGVDARKMIGVGNEAIACTVGKSGNPSDRVVGRVRQRAFTISLSMPGISRQKDPNEQQLRQEKIQNLAEQVAGSLF